MIAHKKLANGEWEKLSLIEQMANIGSEVFRTMNWKKKDEKNAKTSFIRVLELLDLSLKDKKNKDRLKEIARAREVLSNWYLDNAEFKITDNQLRVYFLQFAKAVRKDK